MVFRNFKIRDHLTTLARRIVQILSFLLINFIILEFIFSINLVGIESFLKVLPVLNSPRNPLSEGMGIVEAIFYSIAIGDIPFFLIGVLLLILLFTNRFFCGWICPIGSIQDLCAAIPVKKKPMKLKTHKTLLNVKYVIIIILIILIVPLGVTAATNYAFWFDFYTQLGSLAQKPVGFFSLSEYIFVFFPKMAMDIYVSGGLGPLFSNFGGFIIFIIYLIIIILSLRYPRFYCRYFCPFAAVSAAVTDYSFLKLSRNPVKCVGRSECGECERVCPKQIRILDEPFEFFTGKGECNLCLKCKEKCPYDAIKLKFGSF
ncbi:MAG: 4Fe-4S binding protein [Candidatus Hermodarchaeota archaeon]